MTKTYVCPVCSAEKPASEFPKIQRDGVVPRRAICSTCREQSSRERQARYRQSHPLETRAATKKWRENHLEHARIAMRTWRQNNPEKARAIDKRNREKHAVEARERGARYRRENREKVALTKAKWRAAHPAAVLEMYRKNRIKNREAGLDATRRWYAAHPEAVAAKAARRRSRNTAAGALSSRTVREVFDESLGLCTWCSARLPRSGMTLDHVIPLAAGGTNAKENLTAACLRCNSIKNTRSVIVFLGEKRRKDLCR